MLSFLFILGVLTIDLNICNGEYYAITRNPNLLDRWASAEIELVSKLKISSENISSMAVVTRYIQDFDDAFQTLNDYNETAPHRESSSAVTSNPVAVYRMIRRLAYQFPDLRTQVKPLDEGLFYRLHDNVRLETKDVQDTIAGILRILHVYNFPPSSFAEGNFGGVETGTKLKGIHCYEIGREALRLEFYTLSIEWLEVALVKARNDSSIDPGLAKSLLDVAILKHDEKLDSRGYYDPYYYNQKLVPILHYPNYTATRVKQRDVLEYYYSRVNDTSTWYLNLKFTAICSRNSIQTAEEKSHLFCWYESKADLYWLIGPLKMEFLAKDPDIVQIYEIIGERQTEDLKKTVEENLRQSSVVDSSPGAAPGAQMVSNIRTSVNGWITEYSHPTLYTVSKTMEKITGLKVIGKTASDAMQVATYSFGGHYEAHLDALIVKGFGEESAGERIATFLYYLEEPQLGGQTAFTEGKVAALPIKGSAVFWYGIYKNGEADFHTYHGACPVVLGRKWVANKWIRYFDQFSNRRCGLQPVERYRIPANNDCIP